MLSRCFLDFSVGVGAFVIELSQISSFFSPKGKSILQNEKSHMENECLLLSLLFTCFADAWTPQNNNLTHVTVCYG